MPHPFKPRLLRIISLVLSFLFLYIALPVYLTATLKNASFKFLILFYLACVCVILYLFRKNSHQRYHLEYKIQDLQEKFNILNNKNSQDLKNSYTLKEKIKRYHSLKNIIEEINRHLDTESVASTLTSIVFFLIANNRGVCKLYLVDNQTQKLNLFKAVKENKKLVIRAKEGDIFDFWVLRHVSPLLIEDIRRDFRFDLERLKRFDNRPFASLISCPFVSENNFLGILRLDNTQGNSYSQDDLRFLGKICDLGAVALENAQLFQRTQDLALHDGLTSLYTKGYFLQHLKEECKRGLRQKLKFSLLMLDIDLFKNYNDKFGHSAGDIVLKKLTQVVAEYLKQLNPFISRFGGEEFCIILPETEKEAAFKLAVGLCKRMEEEKIMLRREETHITVSIGIASFPSDAQEDDDLIQKSDRAMYQAKQKGRNQACSI